MLEKLSEEDVLRIVTTQYKLGVLSQKENLHYWSDDDLARVIGTLRTARKQLREAHNG